MEKMDGASNDIHLIIKETTERKTMTNASNGMILREMSERETW